jgi:CheY-like chemotaxis protein/HPt (histidine-containing phosphotransfer) domain-containing protein
MNIVILDDEPVSLAVMKQLVAKLPDCEAHAFTEASAALIWCMNNTTDLVIVDYSMPALDGVEFTRRLRALPNDRRTPVVMVSAVVDDQVIKRALQSGVDDFLHKPFDFVELQTCVSEMLGLRAMQGQLANKALLVQARALTGSQGGVPQLLNRNVSRARLGGDEKLLGEVAHIFMHTVPAVLREIRAAVLDNDFDAVLAHVISLKGAVSAVEAPDVLNFLSRLEYHATIRDPIATVAAFAMVQAVTERLFSELAPIVPTPRALEPEEKTEPRRRRRTKVDQ